MIPKEVAEKQLEKFVLKDWQERRITALEKLPAKLHEKGELLLGKNVSLEDFLSVDFEAQQKKFDAAMEALDSFSPEERISLFTALFPKMAAHIEAMWQCMYRYPYHISWMKKPFRAPYDPGVTRPNRVQSL